MRQYQTSVRTVLLLAAAILSTIGIRPAGGEEIDKLMADFLAKPDKIGYLKVFEAVVSSPQYDPYSDELDEVYELIEKKDYQAAETRLKAAMPNLLLSPRAHLMARRVAEGLGNADLARHEDEVATKCLQGIMSTGRGDSPVSPWTVTRTSDEYDVLRSLKRETSFQAIRKFEDRYYDVFRFEGDKEVWFDITVAYNALRRQIQQEN